MLRQLVQHISSIFSSFNTKLGGVKRRSTPFRQRRLVLEMLEDRTVPSVSITSPGDQVNYVGDTVDVAVVASDTSGDPLNFSASGLPGNLSVDSSTGEITGTVTDGADFSSPYTVTLTASDEGQNENAQTTFTWTINDPVTLTNPGNQNSSAGDHVSLQINASDAVGGTLSYFFIGLPDGLTGDQNTGLISGTIADEDVDGAICHGELPGAW